MCIAEDKRGNQLLELIRGDERELVSGVVCKSALAVVKSPSGFMLLKNKYRKEWELAGGVIEAGETPRECAAGECFEESGYGVSALRFIGIAKFFLVPSFFSKENRVEYSALYCADVDVSLEFKENDEMADLCRHTIGEPLEDANEIDVKLLEDYCKA